MFSCYLYMLCEQPVDWLTRLCGCCRQGPCDGINCRLFTVCFGVRFSVRFTVLYWRAKTVLMSMTKIILEIRECDMMIIAPSSGYLMLFR